MNIEQFASVTLIMVLAVVVIIILLARKNGKDPMEMLFGSRGGDTAFSRTKCEAAKSGQSSTAGRTGTGAKQKETGNGGNASAAMGTKDDLMQAVSKMVNYARRHHFFLIYPGRIEAGGQVASLMMIMVTTSGVIGINCYGFGGKITASGEEDWHQRVGNEDHTFASPVKKNKAQEQILKNALSEIGYSYVPAKVFGIFTNESAQIKDGRGSGCVKASEIVDYLDKNPLTAKGQFDSKAIGRALGKKMRKAEKAH